MNAFEKYLEQQGEENNPIVWANLLEEIPTMESGYLYDIVEAMLDYYDINDSSESWGETATRIERDEAIELGPTIANILRAAEIRWFELGAN